MEYAFEGHVDGKKKYWADAYPKLQLARKAAKQWVGSSPNKSAVLVAKEALPTGHQFGATWRQIEFVGPPSWTHSPGT